MKSLCTILYLEYRLSEPAATKFTIKTNRGNFTEIQLSKCVQTFIRSLTVGYGGPMIWDGFSQKMHESPIKYLNTLILHEHSLN
jgi:hypothetical protein